MFILISMVQVRLMNVLTSFTSLYTTVFRLITIKVRHSYLQAHLDLHTMYSITYLGVFRYINMGFATVFITMIQVKEQVTINVLQE